MIADPSLPLKGDRSGQVSDLRFAAKHSPNLTGESMNPLLQDAAERSARYLKGLNERPVFPPSEAIGGLEGLNVALPAEGLEPTEVLRLLDKFGSPATVASAGQRFFGFVIGGSLPAALAAHWPGGAWGQKPGLLVGF